MFQDVTNPMEALRKPPKAEEFPNPLEIVNKVGDAFSLTVWGSDLVFFAIGVNPLTEITEWLTGDWEKFVDAGHALKNLSESVGGIASNVSAGRQELSTSWRGQAADLAFAYFAELSNDLADYSKILDRLHEEYLKAARAVWETAKAVADYLKMLGDTIISALLKMAAGAVLAETGVGAVVCWSLAAFEILRIIEIWQGATRLLEVTSQVLYVTSGTIRHMFSEIDSLSKLNKQSGVYDHPGVIG